jgi:membrane-associated phospholipid phosphatase
MHRAMLPLRLCIAGLICAGCEGRDTESPVQAPGAKRRSKPSTHTSMAFISTTAIWDNRWKRTTTVPSSTRTLPSA